MTKKTGSLIFFAFILITGTEYLHSMEKEKEEDSKTVVTLPKIFQNLSTKEVSQGLSTDKAKLIVIYKHSVEEGDKQNAMDGLKTASSLHFDSPCGAGSRTNSVLDKENNYSYPNPESSEMDYSCWFFPHPRF